MPQQYDLAIWKGNDFALPLRLKTRSGASLAPVDLTGSTLVFRAVWPGGSLRKPSPDGWTINAAQGEATLALTVAETRLIPMGARVKYEIERRVGSSQATIMYGLVKVSEWANDD